MYQLEGREPARVLRHFEDISRIPRGSGNEKAVSDFILAYAQKLGLFAMQDEASNLVIRKPATAGYEQAPCVMIQGHLDMVNEKNRGTKHDFEKDPIDLYADGDFIKARGTTLGADNGVAVAMAMALMEDTVHPHPALEFVLTTDEEVGMNGAVALSPANLTGKVLINIDNEDEGVFLSSCAGGLKATLSLQVEKIPLPTNFKAFSLFLSGLKGGHSGMDIHKSRGNAILLLGRALTELSKEFELYIACFSGGSKDNAIPREAECLVSVEESKAEALLAAVQRLNEMFQNEYRVTDPNVGLVISNGTAKEAYSSETSKKLLAAISLMPNGVLAMSQDFEGLVETSSNLGVVKEDNGYVKMVSAIRSMVAAKKQYVLTQIQDLADLLGAAVTVRGEYPSWEYNPDSPLRKVFTDTYFDLYGKEARIDAIHAGVECGLFAEKVKGLDMISFGPQMYDVHTPDERVSISSLARSWDFLLAVLARIKD